MANKNKEDFVAAIANNNWKKLENILNKNTNFDIDSIIKDESTALHLAVQDGNITLTKLLLKYDANPELEDEKGNNCLHLACKTDCLELVKLFSHTIDVNTQNFNMYTPLHIAVIENKYETVEFLLNNKANVNAQEALGFTPLHLAVRNKNISLIECLLKYKANPNIQDIEGMSPFYRSFYVYRQNISNSMINLFLNYGASVHLKDMFDNNALHIAILFGTNEFLQKLLHMKMNVNETNESKKLPLNFAMETYPHFSNNIVSLISRIKIEILIKHMVILMSQNVHVDTSNLELIESNKWMIEAYEMYTNELIKMQTTKVAFDSNVTYYDILVKRGNALVNCLKSEMVNTTLSFGDYKSLFFNYSREMEINYLYGLELIQKIIKFQLVLKEILGHLLPNEIIYKLSEFYSDEGYAVCLKN